MDGIVQAKTQRIIVKTTPSAKMVDGSPVQRIDARPRTTVSIVNAGPPGPAGVPGIPGTHGANAGRRFYGEGPPGVILGAEPRDEYLDMLTGNLYVLQ